MKNITSIKPVSIRTDTGYVGTIIYDLFFNYWAPLPALYVEKNSYKRVLA